MPKKKIEAEVVEESKTEEVTDIHEEKELLVEVKPTRKGPVKL